MHNIKVHWSFWVICTIALIWNIMGGANFIMQMDSSMLNNYPESAQQLVLNRPLWATVAFFVAIFAGLIGDILLITKKAIAYYLFVVSLGGILITNIYTLQVSSKFDILFGSFMSLVVAIFLIWYTKFVRRMNWIS